MSTEDICRLCLTTSSDFHCIYEKDRSNLGSNTTVNLRQRLLICVPELKLEVSPNPLICTACLEQLQKAYEFKKRCLQTEQKIKSFLCDNKGKKVNLHDFISTSKTKSDNMVTGKVSCFKKRKVSEEFMPVKIDDVNNEDTNTFCKPEFIKVECTDVILQENTNTSFNPLRNEPKQTSVCKTESDKETVKFRAIKDDEFQYICRRCRNGHNSIERFKNHIKNVHKVKIGDINLSKYLFIDTSQNSFSISDES